MFEFKGDWQTQMELREFSILNNSKYKKRNSNTDSVMVPLDIFDVRNENPDPEIFQLNAINFLLEDKNQLLILKNLLAYSKNVIYPQYKKFMWEEEYPECYPRLEVEKDLSELYGINRVIIKTIEKDNFAYFVFDCSSCLDYEHGITITLYKDQIIDHGENWDDQKVCAHKGIDYKTYHEKEVADYNKRILELARPHPKYGKLKPFQKDQNDFYPFGLFHNGQEKKLIEVLSEGKIENTENVVARLLSMSIANDREELLSFLLVQNPAHKHSAFMESLAKDRFDITDKLLDLGYNINEKVAQDSPFYHTISVLVKELSSNSDYHHIIERLKYLLEKGLNPELEDEWGRNSFYVIERIDSREIKMKVEKILNGIK